VIYNSPTPWRCLPASFGVPRGAAGSAFTYTFRSGVALPFFSDRRNEYTAPVAVTRFRFVAAPSEGGALTRRLTASRLLDPVLLQTHIKLWQAQDR